MTEARTAQVLLDVRDGVARITLNRPRALNALTRGMVSQMSEALAGWAVDPRVRSIVLTGAGERGLCAGGDVRVLFEQASRDPAAAREFWRAEYALVAAISRLPVPYVALMHGIVMGGGVGVSAHGRYRVVTETSRVAMPEVAIGFTPDVGGTWLLSRAPGQLGTHVALTAAHLNAADAIRCGLADYYVPWPRCGGDLCAALASAPAPDVLESFREDPPPGTLDQHRGWIDECYGADSVEEILSRLDACRDRAAAAAASRMRRHSPTALKVTLRALRAAGQLSTLEDALSAEFRIMTASLGSHDFREGIRAQLIDRDNDPHWLPSNLAGVTAAALEPYFRPLGDDLAPDPQLVPRRPQVVTSQAGQRS